MGLPSTCEAFSYRHFEIKKIQGKDTCYPTLFLESQKYIALEGLCCTKLIMVTNNPKTILWLSFRKMNYVSILPVVLM